MGHNEKLWGGMVLAVPTSDMFGNVISSKIEFR
jgi:hypothetical protein